MSVPLAPCSRHLVMFININSCNELKSFKIRSCYLKQFNFRQKITRKKKEKTPPRIAMFSFTFVPPLILPKMFLNKRWNDAKNATVI